MTAADPVDHDRHCQIESHQVGVFQLNVIAAKMTGDDLKKGVDPFLFQEMIPVVGVVPAVVIPVCMEKLVEDITSFLLIGFKRNTAFFLDQADAGTGKDIFHFQCADVMLQSRVADEDFILQIIEIHWLI